MAGRKEKDALMNYQKTKNYRDRKKLEDRAERKREASHLSYMKDKKDMIQAAIKKGQDVIKDKKRQIKLMEIQIREEEGKINKAKYLIKKMTLAQEKKK